MADREDTPSGIPPNENIHTIQRQIQSMAKQYSGVKMFNNFKTFFSTIYFEIKEYNDLVTKITGYLAEEINRAYNTIGNDHQANLVDTLNNMVNAVKVNTNTVQQFTAENKN